MRQTLCDHMKGLEEWRRQDASARDYRIDSPDLNHNMPFFVIWASDVRVKGMNVMVRDRDLLCAFEMLQKKMTEVRRAREARQ